jgi:hypothetical protein
MLLERRLGFCLFQEPSAMSGRQAVLKKRTEWMADMVDLHRLFAPDGDHARRIDTRSAIQFTYASACRIRE